jgi:hypothetical protein
MSSSRSIQSSFGVVQSNIAIGDERTSFLLVDVLHRSRGISLSLLFPLQFEASLLLDVLSNGPNVTSDDGDEVRCHGIDQLGHLFRTDLFQFIHSSRGLRLSQYVSLDHQR